MNIGRRLYELRAAKGFYQGDIEKRTGLIRCYISRVENGHTILSLQTLEKLAGALEIEFYHLFFKSEKKPKIVLLKKQVGLDAKERRLLGTFKKLNKQHQRVAVGMIGRLARASRSAGRAT